MDYGKILKFKGTWRNYQARVLANAQKYIRDGRIHIVAAPGSGKTTLGIELIARSKEPALVLVPSIAIREQWAQRIEEGFLCEGLQAGDYISQDLKNPKCITIATYQSLHSAMNRYRGMLQEEAEASDEQRTEEVDYSGFDIIAEIKASGIGLFCLDECHHLRSEWWKALEELKAAAGNLKVIALTATPPYDSTPALWKRYMDMCGEIDEEIEVPELVKEGSLCPHQDFVYFNYPTEEETQEIEKFRSRSKKMQQKLLWEDKEFLAALQTHGGLNGSLSEEQLLESPDGLMALLVFLQARNIPFPTRLQQLLGTKRLPSMSEKWMERLLQDFLYDNPEAYSVAKEYREQLIGTLKSEGLIEKRKVTFCASDAVEKLLTNSKGKCRSIQAIAEREYAAGGKELRMLILTDYIRKEYEKAVGVLESDVLALGVLPFFEQLRRIAAAKNAQEQFRLGVLCGTMVIIPAEAKEALLAAAGEKAGIVFSGVGNLPENDYVKVTASGDSHFLTAAVTEIFSQGHMQILIGTKSLLGEGWDSPCINSLILASFVGSFMLSNQMRGRAIRVWNQNPEKTSNIWHLVCFDPERDEENKSEDYELLERRMEHFVGLHYTQDVIESGMERLSIIRPPFHKKNVDLMNRQMLELSEQRDTLRQRWENALVKSRRMELAEETEVPEIQVSKVVLENSLRGLAAAAAGMVVFGIAAILCSGKILGAVFGALAFGMLVMGVTKLPKILWLRTAEKRLKAYGNGIREALLRRQLLESKNSRVMTEAESPGCQSIYLEGGSARDKTLFAQCTAEFFGPVEQQRYLLTAKKKQKGSGSCYCVPECFAKRKEDAESFYQCMKPVMGEYRLVYTRNESGRQVLLKERMRSLAEQRGKRNGGRRKRLK